ncbi:hypothetical protein BISA_1602 [Bifidobacterium saguini DSM 23967]|uniref:Uncharacterized protein n=2 Tax=Bifidobacterium saguini TaxID=762210 RepID=A0A087DDB4_9BIFI|nr:hypothetical protein BISA_1602 [Bifidobacterium saguini DSM 23967]
MLFLVLGLSCIGLLAPFVWAAFGAIRLMVSLTLRVCVSILDLVWHGGGR